MRLLGLCYAGSWRCGHATRSILLPVDRQQLRNQVKAVLVEQRGSSCKRPNSANRITILLSDAQLGTGTADVATLPPIVCDPDDHPERVVA